MRNPVPAAIAFVVLAWAMLVVPDHPSDLSVASLLWLPLELPLLVVLLCLPTGRIARLLRMLVVLALATSLLLRLFDMATATAFQRGFNPYLDRRIVFDGWNLLSGSIGLVPASLLAALVGVVLLGLLFVLYRTSAAFRRLGRGMRATLAAACLLVAALGAVILARQPEDGRHLVQAREAPMALRRVAEMRQAMRAIGSFDAELAAAQSRIHGNRPSFAPLAGRDVVVAFVESYGRSAVEDPRYAPTVDARLAQVEAQLSAAGLHAVSGWLTAPTAGGLSWLAHGTLLSGLWVDNQVRYDRLVRSRQPTLNGLFREAGWRTVAVMPAITMDWPEARYFGYDRVLAAADLGYRGKPFNWVTMPDQFTLAAFDRMERPLGPRQPVMAEVALISSHAPWTPIPSVVAWNAVGDGSIFDAQASAGESPRTIWADESLIRRQYLASIDYVLDLLGSWMARAGDGTVFILLGDHQPAPVITGIGASRDVPVHVVTDDPALLARLSGLGWVPGMVPTQQVPPMRMDRFRDAFIEAFGG